MVDFKRITDRAKDVVEKRGGSDSLKKDANELKGIAKGPGSFRDKAKAAVDAIKAPGGKSSGDAGTRPATPPAATPPERDRAADRPGDGDPAV